MLRRPDLHERQIREHPEQLGWFGQTKKGYEILLRRALSSWLGLDISSLAGVSIERLLMMVNNAAEKHPAEPAMFALRPEGTEHYGVREGRAAYRSPNDFYRAWTETHTDKDGKHPNQGERVWNIAFVAMWGGQWRAFVGDDSDSSLLRAMYAWYRAQDWAVNQDRYYQWQAAA